MVVLVFLSVVMLFAVNPFATTAGGAPPDGRGLNYQLRNFYMIVHPPALYLGFTSAAVPFAFAVAALLTGRLGNEWIVASRKWMLFSWLFLTIGNGLGMVWAYEELGWGGYWAWDPVENASLLPWLTATAYLHSITIQERRGMLKIWNVLLVCMTFLLTLFGTFITRSGLIASVHAFSKSSIGSFFLVFMGMVLAGCLVLALVRLGRLWTEAHLESPTSRESAFFAQNWLQLGITLFVTAATLWPTLSEWLLKRKATVGPTFYNTFVPPLALLVIALMGLAPLLGWRRTSSELFARSIRWPATAGLVAAGLHLALGRRLGLPAFVSIEPVLQNWLGTVMASVVGKLPVVTVALVVFNLTVVVQEFARGVRARRARQPESVLAALRTLVDRSRRRYGGYVVHVGVAVMFLGFAGRAWGTDAEASLRVGEQVTVGAYTLIYTGTHENRDEEKQIVSTELDVWRGGQSIGRLTPAKYVYDASPEQPSTEVGRLGRWHEDVYVILGMLDRRAEVASFQIHLNPLVSLVWLGIIIASLGALIAMWPEGLMRRARAFGYVRKLEARAGATK
jgi:cytochrome c-type biogenesis protein CcmF